MWEAMTWLEKPQDCTSSVWAQWDEHGQRNQVRVSAASSVGSGRLRDCTLAGRGGRGGPKIGVGGHDMAGEAPGLHQQCVGPMG